MKDKRGQVTLFVILGIVVLIIVGIAVFFISLKNEDVDSDVFETNYDAKLAPIYNDVVFCIDLLAKDAIIKIGATGGHIEVKPIEYTYNSHFEYDNDALELFPGSGLIIPYWLHIAEAPDCTDCIEMQSFPYLTGEDSIQSSIETYVESNLATCVNNFSNYDFDLEVTHTSGPECTVELRDENVFIGVTWPLSVKFADETVSMSLSKYSSTIDVRLKKMYEYALSVLYQTEMAEEQRAFEYFMKDIITFYSFGGEDALIPPVEGPTTFEFKAPTIWLEANVENQLKNAVAENIPYMQVVGTKDSFILFTDDSIKSNFYSNFQNAVYYDDAYAQDVRVRFNYYPMWPFYVSVGPSDGPVIMAQPATVNMWLLKLSTTQYKFYYDVAYPVLVTLEDDSAFGGEGFLFNYAFEVNLRDNDLYSNESISMDSYLNESDEIEDLGYSQRTVPVKINVINGYDELPVDGVTVSYTCLDKEYIVGTSKSSASNPNAYIDSFLAPCLGGRFSLNEFGYAERPLYKDVVLGDPLEFTYKIYPSKNITIDLRKRLFAPTVTPEPTDENPNIDRQWQLSSYEGYTSDLETDEEVIVMMSEIRSDGSSGNVVYLESQNADKTVSLSPGNYQIEVISTLKLGDNYSRQNLTIPGRTMKVKGDDIVINDTVIENTMYLGGLSLNEENAGMLTITPDQIKNKQYLVIYYPSYNPDELEYTEDFNVLEKLMIAKTDYPGLFVPVFE